MEIEISSYIKNFSYPFSPRKQRISFVDFFARDRIVKIFIERFTTRNGFDIIINPLIWKFLDLFERYDAGTIVSEICYEGRLSESLRLPKSFVATAIRRYGAVGDKILCKRLFEIYTGKKFSLSKLFWKFSRFDPLHDVPSTVFRNGPMLCSNEVYFLFLSTDKKGNEMKNFMWKIENLNFSTANIREIISIYRKKIQDDPENVEIYNEIISILNRKIGNN